MKQRPPARLLSSRPSFNGLLHCLRADNLPKHANRDPVDAVLQRITSYGVKGCGEIWGAIGSPAHQSSTRWSIAPPPISA